MADNEKTADMEFEKHIESALAGRKDEIERSLAETIEQEKEKARRRIAEMEQEFQKGKDALRRHKEMLDEVAAAAADAGTKIRRHVEQARHCRTMIRRMAGQIGEECRTAAGIKRDVFDLYAKADDETRRLQKDLESRYGTSIPLPESLEILDFMGGLDGEIEDLAAFAASLDAGEPVIANGSGIAAPNPCGEPETPAGTPMEPPAETRGEDQAAEPPAGPAAPFPQADRLESGESEEARIAKALESRRKTESFPGGGELHMYQSGEMIVLDGEALLDQMIRFIEDAKTLHARLEETKSAKEQFFIKRDILNLQEYLRKIVVRAIKLAEKETCDLPLATMDVMSLQTLRDVLERLSMGNWSDAYDMRMFGEEIFKLRATLFARTSARNDYKKAILEQLRESA